MSPPGEAPDSLVDAVGRLLARAVVLLDFDGTLSELAPRPDLARPEPEVPALLARLAAACRRVAIVTGRPAAEVRDMVAVDGVGVLGHYGLGDRPPPSAVETARPSVRAAAAAVRGAWVEDKGASLAVHFRQAADPPAAERVLASSLGDIASAHGLELLRGKMTLELVPPGTPGKGALVLAEVAAVDGGACLYAGDDLADLSAFEALDELRRRGLVAVKVAVRGAETPEELLDAADVVVDGPAGLVDLLGSLLAAGSDG